MSDNNSEIMVASDIQDTNAALMKAPAFVQNEVLSMGMFATVNEEDETRRKVMTYNATQDSVQMRTLIESGETIAPKGIIVRADEIENEDGGHDSVPCVIIIDEGGRSFMSHSASVLNSIAALFSSFGSDLSKWPAGMRLAVVERSSQRGRRFHTIKVVF